MGLGTQGPLMQSDASHLICFSVSLQLNISRSPKRPEAQYLFTLDWELAHGNGSINICGKNGCINEYNEATLKAEGLLTQPELALVF